MAFLPYRNCPHCREAVRNAATVCPHCTRDIPAVREERTSPASIAIAVAVGFALVYLLLKYMLG